jgi:hypothetical protein
MPPSGYHSPCLYGGGRRIGEIKICVSNAPSAIGVAGIGHHEYVRAPRAYRHRPWLVLTTLLMLFVLVSMVRIIEATVRAPGFEAVVRAVIVLVPLAVAVGLLGLTWRIRTVVDDSGVTQHWITRSFYIPYADITDLEPVHVYSRWFLRVHCGERTFEVIPCMTFIWQALAAALGPPRAMVAARRDLEQRRVANTGDGRPH